MKQVAAQYIFASHAELAQHSRTQNGFVIQNPGVGAINKFLRARKRFGCTDTKVLSIFQFPPATSSREGGMSKLNSARDSLPLQSHIKISLRELAFYHCLNSTEQRMSYDWLTVALSWGEKHQFLTSSPNRS